MKQEFDKQFDSLLRGTRGGADARRAASAASEHLSPDELSAYAENALPQPARALYTAHIADCADCRRVVTSVALASGAEAALEARPAGLAEAGRVAAGTSWGARLAALFSPRVLAYVAPVLAVAIIGALALVVLRGRQGAEAPNVAQHEGGEAARPGPITQTEPATGTTTAPAPAANMAANAPVAQGGPAAGIGAGTVTTEDAVNAPEPAKVLTREEEKATARDSAAVRSDADESFTALQAPRPAAAAAPAPPPVASAQPAELTAASPASAGARAANAREADNKEEARQQSSATEDSRMAERGEEARRSAPEPERGRAMDRNARSEPRLYDDRSKSDGTVPSETEGLVAARRRARGPARATGGASAETRSVAGREFRRQGGAWVDVNYRPSMSTVNVRRGSESFRSLVADIPEVGSAASQLSGTVIIVARGRAYRVN